MTEQLKPFPKQLGQKLLSDAVKNESMLQKLYEPARCRYFENVSSSESAAVGSEDPECRLSQNVKVCLHRQRKQKTQWK